MLIARAYRTLIGAYNPMLCPVHVFQAPIDDVDRNGAVAANQPKKAADEPHPLEAASAAVFLTRA